MINIIAQGTANSALVLAISHSWSVLGDAGITQLNPTSLFLHHKSNAMG